MYKIGIIGCGNMGEALIKGLRGERLFVCESNSDRVRYLKEHYHKITVAEIQVVIAKGDIVIIAVKPQDMETAFASLKADSFKQDKLFISIAAGLTTTFLEQRLKSISSRVRIVRSMPNMPAMIAEGITAVCPGKYAKDEDIKLACTIFDHLGKTVVVTEDLMDAVTAVSGCGPAYVFFFMECLNKAAQSVGLKGDLGQELVLATFLGSLHLLEKQKMDPAVLRAKVTSKGGTTQAALEVLYKNNFEKILTEALQAARKRASELSRR